jgi:hypothetical protein
MERKKNRFRIAPQTQPEPSRIVQVMPGRKLRLDPSVIPDLVSWLVCRSARWETVARMTLRGLKGHDRESRKGLIRYAKLALSVVQTLINNSLEQWPIDEHESALRIWRMGDDNDRPLSPPHRELGADGPPPKAG